jgi:hypothetical protein
MEGAVAGENVTDIVVQTNPLALIGDLTLTQVLEGWQPVGEWRYSFKVKGKQVEGLSADGVQDGVRQMSRKGEAIRCLWSHLERDTEREAFFVAMAARYAIAPDGREICMDTTVRGKRVPKYEMSAPDDRGEQHEYFNKDWFEHGITKSARNAEEALMPEALKQWMLAEARKQDEEAPANRQAQPPRAPRPARNTPERSRGSGAAPPASDDAERQALDAMVDARGSSAQQRAGENPLLDEVKRLWAEVQHYAPINIAQVRKDVEVAGKVTDAGNIAWSRMTADELRHAQLTMGRFLETGPDGKRRPPRQTKLGDEAGDDGRRED